MDLHYLIFMGGNLGNEKKPTPVRIVNSVGVNSMNIVNNVGISSDMLL